MGKHERAPTTVAPTSTSNDIDVTSARKKRKLLASSALPSNGDDNGSNTKILKKRDGSHRSVNGTGDGFQASVGVDESTAQDQIANQKRERKKRWKDSEHTQTEALLQAGEDSKHSTGRGIEDATAAELRQLQGQISGEEASKKDQPDLVHERNEEQDKKEASSSRVAQQIDTIQSVDDIDSPLLRLADGEPKKISKAKRRRVKLLRKTQDQANGSIVPKTKSLDTQSIDSPESPSHASLEKRTLTYVESTELATTSQELIDSYLASNAISIEESPTTKPLRPILDFKYIPPHTLQDHSVFKEFKRPTPIQAATWPYLLSGQDVVGVAETGSGKTLAFGVPCIRRFSSTTTSKTKRKSPVRAVIVSPTRELALQIHHQFLSLTKFHNLNPVCIYGGVPKDPQRLALPTSHIIIATPGRLNDLIDEGSADLSNVDYLVLDEADRMLDKGFEDSIRRIISACSPHPARQTCMFTATWPPSVRSLAESFMRTPVKIRIGDTLTGELRANARIEQRVEVLDTNPRSKENRLLQLVRQFQKQGSKNDRILVFALYKKEAVRVESFLRSKGFKAAGIHGDLSQDRRTSALDAFKRGTTPILVATDVAARGLDIPAVKAVINITFPLTVEDYVHRIGRTGRAGADGVAVTLFTEHDKGNSGALINVLKAAKQVVPEELVKFGTTVKKREHEGFGALYREVEGAKKATKIRFD